MEMTVDDFPFAANALRRAEAIVYPQPYVTPWTRISRKDFIRRQAEVVEESRRRRKAISQSRFTAEDIADMQHLYMEGGMTPGRIADLFDCSQNTVRYHIRNVQRATAA